MGYSRAVRVENHIFVAGTTALNAAGQVTGVGDAYAQARHALRLIQKALGSVGASLHDVVRTRMYVVDIEAHSAAVGRAHGEVFRDIRPASTMVEVSRLIDPQMLVEIEAEALCLP